MRHEGTSFLLLRIFSQGLQLFFLLEIGSRDSFNNGDFIVGYPLEFSTFFSCKKPFHAICATRLKNLLRNGSFPTELLFLYSAWQVLDYTAMTTAESVFQCLGSEVCCVFKKMGGSSMTG